MKNIIAFNLGLLLLASNSFAGDLVYQPQNTAFGGGNGTAAQILMSKAQAQDTTENPKKVTTTTTPQTEVEKFKANLERRILDQMARQIISGVFPNDGSGLDETGTYSTDEFSIIVNNDNPDVISLSITEFATGAETNIDIPKF